MDEENTQGKPAKQTGPGICPSSEVDDDWLAGLGASVQAKARKLLDQVPPEVRKNLIKQAREHGPRATLIAVDAAAVRVRGLKAKVALRALSGLLRMFVSTKPEP